MSRLNRNSLSGNKIKKNRRFQMSRNEIITGYANFMAAPLEKYSYPKQAGEFIGTLMYRTWHPKSKCLLSFFDTDDGEKIKLMSWWDRNYSPKQSCISFADDVANGSRWRCAYDKGRNGAINWQTAEKI